MIKRIPYILFLFSAIFNYGQVTLAISEVKDQKVNQKFNLTVLLEISGENMEQETPLKMPDFSKFNIVGSASERNTVVLDASKGTVVDQLVYQYVLSPKQAGKIKIGSVLVTVNGKIYKTEPFDINVRENEKISSVADNDRNDLYLNLEVRDKVVYKNEPTIAVLRAYSRNYDNFRKVGNIQFGHQRHVSIKPVNLAKSEIESNSGIASQVIGVFMIFPSETGFIEINPITASYNITTKGSKITSNKVTLNVKKLPGGMPANFKNAVGQFKADVFNPNASEIPEIDKPVNIQLKLAGSGNLGSLNLPKLLESPDYVFYSPKISTQTTTNKKGLSGTVTAEYVVVPKKSGLVKVQFEDFSYFDPASGSYTDLGAKEILLNVKTPQEIADNKSPLEKMNEYTNTVLETVNTPVLQTHNLKIKDKNTINWNIVFGNLALLTGFVSLFLIVMHRKEKRRLKRKTTVAPSSSLSIAETEELLRKNLTYPFAETIEYLKKLKDNKDFTTFFETYDELHREAKKHFSATSDSEFRSILEQTKGQQVAEQYRVLSGKIQIEKFAPFHNEEEITNLYNIINNLYSDINK